jgi:hypothetical protein
MRMTRELHGSPTRLDPAADVGPETLARKRIVDMRSAFRGGRCKTDFPTTSTHWHESDREGEGRTLNVGSMKSPAYLRAYDKRGLLRLEWQISPQNKKTRRQLPDLIDEHGIGAIWRGASQKCVWPHPWYKRCIKGDAVELEPKPVIPSDLHKFIEAVTLQHGFNFFLMQLLGMSLADVSRKPDYVSSTQFARMKKWATQAANLGYDPKDLQGEIEQCRKPTK